MNKFVVTLIALILFYGCSTKYDKVVTQGELAGLKIGQSKHETLKALASQRNFEVYPMEGTNPNYKASVYIYISNIDEIHKLNDKRGICLSGYENLNFRSLFNTSNELTYFESSPEMKTLGLEFKVGQSKTEVLRLLKTLVSTNEFLTIKDCIKSFGAVNPIEITEEETLFITHFDLWSSKKETLTADSNAFFEKNFVITDLYFSNDSLKKIVRHHPTSDPNVLYD